MVRGVGGPPCGAGDGELSAPGARDLSACYRGRRVLVTGHTGFKGAWLAFWLHRLGAKVTGLALPAESDSLFAALRLGELIPSVEGDVRDVAVLERTLADSDAEMVFHLAAQSLVRTSYADPLGTFSTNTLGTAAMLEAVRRRGHPCAVVAVTSDKCYEPSATPGPHAESDALGGPDPYSASKGAAEIVISSYRRSFFSTDRVSEHGVALASARAGNVIGGGDRARDRIVPDAIRALERNEPIAIRNPHAVRPWQHVLEALGGYLHLGTRLMSQPEAIRASSAWNLGPPVAEVHSVARLADLIVAKWGSGSWLATNEAGGPAELAVLLLDSDKARVELGWTTRWGLDRTVEMTTAWYRAQHAGATVQDLRALSDQQIATYLSDA